MSSNASGADPNAPVGVDPDRASVARVYDFLLGGKDNYAIDRRTAHELALALPDVVDLATVNRAFLTRIARFVARQTDVTQYLDLGSGLPSAENVHQIVQRITPESKVVYVDHDPVVLAHGRALLQENEQTRLVDGDIFDPPSILDNDAVRGHLDFTQPIALFCIATLHHHKGRRHEAAQVMREYIDALAPGSYVAVSHFIDPENDDTEATQRLEEALANGSLGGATPRTGSEIRELFHDLEIIKPNATAEPSIVELVKWWPEGPQLKPSTVAQRLVAGGIGRKV